MSNYGFGDLNNGSGLFGKLTDLLGNGVMNPSELVGTKPNAPRKDSFDVPVVSEDKLSTPPRESASPAPATPNSTGGGAPAQPEKGAHQKAKGDPAELNLKITEAPEGETLEDIMAELNELVGLEDIKNHVTTMVNKLKIDARRKELELSTIDVGLHKLFIGNPGTGKTTVARFMGRIYKAIGQMERGHLIEVDRSDLVAGYVGQTEAKAKQILEASLGGVLFIDEAYALVPENGDQDYGSDAINIILKFMEDHKREFVLIAAGYPYEMERFIDSNSGFASRFDETMKFVDYDAKELEEIFDLSLNKNDYSVSKDVRAKIKENLNWFIENKNQNFANGRLMRKYFESIVRNQANRLAKSSKELTEAQLRRITVSDLPKALEELL